MLKQRIITALILLVILLPALFHPSAKWLGLLILLLIMAGAWEWGRLSGLSFKASCAMAFVTGLVALFLGESQFLVGSQWNAFWRICVLVWLLILVYFLRHGSGRWQAAPSLFKIGLGIYLLSTSGVALYQAKILGISFLLSVLCLVWAADIAAYFVGRRFGRRKLAPSISPGKSIEGALGGLLAVGALAGVWLLASQLNMDLDGSMFHRLKMHGSFFLVLCLLCLAVTSVAGDLFESMMKRSAGVKDSSALLPGHGGVLDRLDALLPVLPLSIWLTGVMSP